MESEGDPAGFWRRIWRAMKGRAESRGDKWLSGGESSGGRPDYYSSGGFYGGGDSGGGGGEGGDGGGERRRRSRLAAEVTVWPTTTR